MNLVAISDLHGNLPKKVVLPGDVLCISGDICPARAHNDEFQSMWLKDNFIPWIKYHQDEGIVKHVVFVAGNHDKYLHTISSNHNEEAFRQSLPPNVHYLRDSGVTIDGVKFYGTPWTPKFLSWWFMKYENELEEFFRKIPEGTDVLLSHGPPYEYCDSIAGIGEPLGSKALMSNIKKAKPTWVFVGHIHTGSHTPMVIDNGNGHSTNIVNVSILDEKYKVWSKSFNTVV